MNILVFLSTIMTAAAAQDTFLSCSYYDLGSYGCRLTINNPSGWNNFTEVGGRHLEGFSNDDVDSIGASGFSTNIPSIICKTFPNLNSVSFVEIGLTEIGEDTFTGCSAVVWLILMENNISTISENAFLGLSNVRFLYLQNNLITTLPANALIGLNSLFYLDLGSNFLSTLPENVFANQQSLTNLNLANNPFQHISANVVQPLVNVVFIFLQNANISSINNQWFASNTRLVTLDLADNRIILSEDSFVGLEALTTLNMSSNGISEIRNEVFSKLVNLEYLFLTGNNVTELQPDSVSSLGQLRQLLLGDNPLQVIHDGAFRGLGRLTTLTIANCRLRQINSNTFEGLQDLRSIHLNDNQIEELADGVFAPTPNIAIINLSGNRLKTLSRSSFGTLSGLQVLQLDGNIVNAFDRSIIDDALSLNTLFFKENLCANGVFPIYRQYIQYYLPMLERCFSNFMSIIDTETEGDDDYNFFEGEYPGIAFRVNTDNEVQIALSPFSHMGSPVIEIFLGAANNTMSMIRTNQETNAVTVPTPNIIRRNQWNDFRITWANQVILVFRDTETYPMMAFTVHDSFPVNFYGLRAIETRASWHVQNFS